MDNKIEGGYILMPRAWDESEASDWPPVTQLLWFWLLRNVSHCDYKTLHRGEGFFTIDEIREGLSWKSGYCKGTYSKSQIGRSLQKLQDEGALQKWKSTRGVRVKITNYDFYQNPENYQGSASPADDSTRAATREVLNPDVTKDNLDTYGDASRDAHCNARCEKQKTSSEMREAASEVAATNATANNNNTCGNAISDARSDARSVASGADAYIGEISPKNASNAGAATKKDGGQLDCDERTAENTETSVTHYNKCTCSETKPAESSPESRHARSTDRSADRSKVAVTVVPISSYDCDTYKFQDRENEAHLNARSNYARCTIDKNYKNYKNNNNKEETPKNNTFDILDAEPEPENTNATAAAVTSNLPRAFLDSPFRDESERFAAWFNRELKPQGIRGTQKELSDWALAWYHLRHTDKRDNVAEMGEAIRWARNDPFWSANFQTPNKLRRRDKDGMMYIDRFIALYKRQKNGTTNGKTRKNGRLGDQMPVDAEGLREIAERIANNPRLSH